MRPTIQQLEKKFLHFNQLIFNGCLPVPMMKLTTDIYRGGCTSSTIMEDSSGIILRDNWTIRISIRFDRPEIEYDSILVHEMIHYYIGYNNLHDDCSHGKLFVHMMHEINEKYGLNIQVSGIMDENKISQLPAHQRFFCIAHLTDGQVAIQVVAKNKVAQIWSLYESLSEIQDIEWYTSTNPLLGTFPITSGPSLLFIDEASVSQLQVGAVRLTR